MDAQGLFFSRKSISLPSESLLNWNFFINRMEEQQTLAGSMILFCIVIFNYDPDNKVLTEIILFETKLTILTMLVIFNYFTFTI